MKRRVVLTGLGALTPIGSTAAESWNAARAGACGIGPITRFDTAGWKVTLAGEVKDFDPTQHIDRREARRMDRFTQFAMAAAGMAVADSGLDFSAEDAARCGVLLSTGIGGIETIEHDVIRTQEKGYDKVSPYFVPMVISNMAAGQVAIRFGLQGLCSCVVTACASGANAIGDAFRHIRDGYGDIMLAGGAEAAITPMCIGGFASMKALSTAADPRRASIPFDAERAGFVMGEGAGVLVLEELEHARARGARIYAELVGYGANCDAHHITAPAPNGAGAARCMRDALADAGIEPAAIGYLNAHGTSTPMNDRCETAAVKTAFGAHAQQLAISSTKSMTGHLLGASGAIEAIFTALAVRDGFIPPTIGYLMPDPDCDLDIVPNVGRAADIGYAMSNSLGFGGHNASLIFKKWED